MAMEAGVHILRFSSLAAARLTAMPKLKETLKTQGREGAMIIFGGVAPSQNCDELYKAGAEAIFLRGTVISTAAEDLAHTLDTWLGYRA